MRTFHDLQPGDLFRLGPILVARTDLLEFVRRFGAGPESPGPAERGALVAPPASPFLTLSLVTGALFRELRALGVAVTDLPQLDDVRFPAPVRAHDRLTAEAEVVTRQLLAGGVGLVHLRLLARNQDRQTVLEGLLALPVAVVPRVQVLARQMETR